jgi:heterodisulfide reductase subunit A
MKKEKPKVGVYICHCGTNIAAVVDVEKVTNAVKNIPNVETAKHYVYMCSQPGQVLIKEDIKKLGINRVVVASCSPRMHEATYQKVLEEADINPFFFEMANIREHVSWTHMKNPEEATKKAEDLVRMAVHRAQMLEPISKKEVKVTEKALIIGAGVAGLTAAIDLANRGFEVCLVEREPYIGGNVTKLHSLYWGGEAREYLDSLIKQVQDLKIKTLTKIEVQGIDGYLGNFDVKVSVGARGVSEDLCINCGKCGEVCPVEVPDEFNYNMNKRKAVYLPHPNAVPPIYVVDWKNCTRCGKCVKVCPTKAINLDEKPTEKTIKVGSWCNNYRYRFSRI